MYIPNRERDTNVALKRVSMIETYGVPVYNLAKVPRAVDKAQYEWTIDIETDDFAVLGRLQTAI